MNSVRLGSPHEIPLYALSVLVWRSKDSKTEKEHLYRKTKERTVRK
jgi:hypothetical protein